MTDIKTLCEMIEEIAKDFCLNFCKYADECEKLESEETEKEPNTNQSKAERRHHIASEEEIVSLMGGTVRDGG